MKIEDKLPELQKSVKECMDIMHRVGPNNISQEDINRVRQQLNFVLTNMQSDPPIQGGVSETIHFKNMPNPVHIVKDDTVPDNMIRINGKLIELTKPG